MSLFNDSKQIYSDIIAQNLPLVFCTLLYGTELMTKISGNVSTFVLGFYVSAKCYNIWGAKKKIIALPLLVSSINNGLALGLLGFGGVNQETIKIFLPVNFFTNLFLTLMIAQQPLFSWTDLVDWTPSL
ncbi:hypothetical protein K435DRAFT_799785 [Dendrothele bispora CBS 962.96]|uniref:Uncharacterized protein n=1 Tax=Dendrothele bispora (strain CBS 962.96) TaxID=1314807 RepID=A0A4S8LW51_DENBC|nr:hypothetical protein K435DRAFT_799785 [Dendrothele bispora CBS 962.96]